MSIDIAAPKRNHALLRRAKPLIEESLALAAGQRLRVDIWTPEEYAGRQSDGVSLHLSKGAADALGGTGNHARDIIYGCCWHYIQAIQHAHAVRAKFGGWDVSEPLNGEVLQ